jgi:proteasome accessory factor A
VGSADLVLRMVEAGVVMRDLTLENPIRAIRTMSHDPTGRALVRLANGREVSALDMQREYHDKAVDFVDREGLSNADVKHVLDLWGRALDAIGAGDLDAISKEIDWVIKYQLIERYRARHGLDLGDPRVLQIDLAYHDINRQRGLFNLLQRHGRVARVATDVEVFEAKVRPPQTTRAKLRGDFIRAAQARGRDFTVDWVHLKLNDQAQRTVLCKDPFRAVDERVERLMESMERTPAPRHPPL